ncbi:Transcription factor GTE12 [Dendrobium catenatum]|uniref:Transcription factor GTE12 n=1 Tax=Dendrobium catenatum TaxID=906689 RepID=A0A2I0X3M8_9ASPA|nr:Transcription factor GTE12 [Dendrobium catenatum]
MTSKIGNLNMKKIPIRSFNMRSLSTINKISLKEKLTAELALVRSAIDKIGGDIPRTEQCFKKDSNNTIHSSSTKLQQVPANKKRKSSEIPQANPNKVLSELVANIDSKNSVGALRKKHCSDSNGFDESLCENLISPTKAFRVAKKSRFADTILKAQLKHRNIGLKERAFRMQREKDKLTKAYEEEQMRIEAQVKAAAAQKEKSELRMKIKKERESSRLALEKMEAAVEMNDNYSRIMKELKGLGCQNVSFYVLRQLMITNLLIFQS